MQMGVVIAGFEACVLDAHDGDRFLTQQVEAQATQERLILVSMALVDAALVLSEGDIKDPMHTVLDAPAGAHRIAEGRGIAGKLLR